ncbi:hypothetical protein [Chryseobacterium gambrini]|uniref:Uncharacterized protein n=1 Tax=Chryseobacterium gambrini TaxID=373672 RepID=A0ABM8K8P1_9FLAO|nr:hypothetical protein CRDW_27850 [Chryseobacterium gambrini]
MYLKAGAAIGIPRSLASLLLETTQPSLLESTTTGLFSSFGSSVLSQELSKAFDKSAYQKLGIIKSKI